MKLILISKQIPEIAHLRWRERNALIRRHHWSVYKHWQGWVGFSAFVAAMFFGIMHPEMLIPETVSPRLRLVLRIAIFGGFSLIYITIYYNTIRPHIRRELEFWMGKGFVTKEEDK